MARRALCISLSLLALFLVGTVIVLSSISYYLSIAIPAYITEHEVPPIAGRTNGSAEELIPRIIHQTWKSEVLPERWQPVAQGCKDVNPDYEYMLWTDAKSREFIKQEYSWFLPTFDGYKYPIQRADAIRYFILYHFGGIYLDLDVGCLRPLDPLLKFEVILAKTIPVGVSNDVLFAAKRHPFYEQTIRNLAAFDHSYVINYPTVMFTTGPMFLSAQYSLYTTSHPPSASLPGGEVRVLPKSLYGKNAKQGEAPHAFFSHFYGSSWHADDAGFITFLGKWGKGLMWVGLVVLIGGCVKMLFARRKSHRCRRYRLLLPRAYLDKNGKYRYSFGLFSVPANFLSTSTPSSPGGAFSSPSSPRVPLIPMSIDVAPPSPTSSTSSYSDASSVADSLRRAGAWLSNVVSRPGDGRRQRSRGVLFFLPTIFTPSSYEPISRRDSTAIEEDVPQLRFGLRSKDDAEFEVAHLLAETNSEQRFARSRGSSAGLESRSPSPPPYA